MAKRLLPLIWMLLGTAEALRCLTNGGGGSSVLRQCNSDEVCVTVALRGSDKIQHPPAISRSCVPSSFCAERPHVWSVSYAAVKVAASLHCCNTDGCNNQNISYPDLQTENGLQCFTCIDPRSPACHASVQCVGEQDRCISGRVASGGTPLPFSGCVSADACEALSRWTALADRVNFIGAPTCCGTSFCNSAWTLKLSVVPSLLGLIALVVY